MAEALELTAAIVKALDAKRAMGIEVLHTTDVTTLADYFIMCSAASTTQLRTLSDACEEVKELAVLLDAPVGTAAMGQGIIGGNDPYYAGRVGGWGNKCANELCWLLLDYSTVIIHLFLPEQREFYDLERMWLDADQVDITPFLEEA